VTPDHQHQDRTANASSQATVLPTVVPHEAAESGSTWWPQALHHTISRTFAFAALPSVIGGPGADFIAAAKPIS